MFFRVALRSLLNRRVTALLTLLAVTVSISVLMGVEHLRKEAKSSFSRTVSGVDLIVGARSGQLNLLLYSVFRIGNATNNVSWESYQRLASDPLVAWAVPISLGDSHRGYRVMGTTTEYFTHYKYGKKQSLDFVEGQPFADDHFGVFGAVLGAEVARKLGYELGDKIALTHGTGRVGFTKHDDKPFSVIGIMKATGTPVDQTVHVSLKGIEAIHVDWRNGAPMPGVKITAEQAKTLKLEPKSITAFMVGLKSKFGTFRYQRKVNTDKKEAMLAILPGVALSELWQMMGVMENLLLLISGLVLLAALLGMCTMLLASMRERQREMAVLRAVGAGPGFILVLIQLEALIIVGGALVLAFTLLSSVLVLAQGYLAENYGLFISANVWTVDNTVLGFIVLVSSLVMGLIPSVSAYRQSLHAGLVART